MRYLNLFRRLSCLVTLPTPLVVDGGSFSLNEQSHETPIKGPEFRAPHIPDNNRYFLSTGLKWSVANFMDFDFGYAHLFMNQPDAELLDTRGICCRGVTMPRSIS